MKQYVKVYFQSKGDTEWTDFAFVLITGIIAYHGISCRDVEGERELVHLILSELHYFMESGF